MRGRLRRLDGGPRCMEADCNRGRGTIPFAMTHPLRTTLAAISLVCCGLSAAACVVSYFVPMGMTYAWREAQPDTYVNAFTSLGINAGRLNLCKEADQRSGPWPGPAVPYITFWKGEDDLWFAGITETWLPYTHEGVDTLPAAGSAVTQTQWALPLPLLVLLFALLPIRWAVLRRRERRRNAAGVCVKCGYDLRGSRERCPECGTEIQGSIQ